MNLRAFSPQRSIWWGSSRLRRGRKPPQLHLGGSKVFREYRDPWDFRLGVNWFPWKNTVVRWNAECLQLNRSPVGALSLPFPFGANGPVLQSNLMVYF